jgi:DNA repair protein RadC
MGAARGADDEDRRLLTELLRPFGEALARSGAERLIAAFGTLGGVFAASERRRQRVLGDASDLAPHLDNVRAAMIHILRVEALAGPAISSTPELATYLRAEMAWRPGEQVRVLFLAVDNRLLADEVITEGSLDTAPIPPRPIIHRALDLCAAGLVLVHNHPSGNAAPSRADIDATRALISVCKPIGIIVHDHLIVARRGWTSLRLQGLM